MTEHSKVVIFLLLQFLLCPVGMVLSFLWLASVLAKYLPLGLP